MAIKNLIFSVLILSVGIRVALPGFTSGLSTDQITLIRIAILIVWGVLTLVTGIRSTKYVMWCEGCRCKRCRAIAFRHDF